MFAYSTWKKQAAFFFKKEKKEFMQYNFTSLPNQQRTLNKPLTDIRRRNFCRQAPTEHSNRRQNVQKRVCNVYLRQLNFHSAHHCWWLGRKNSRCKKGIFFRGKLPFFCTVTERRTSVPREKGGWERNPEKTSRKNILI